MFQRIPKKFIESIQESYGYPLYQRKYNGRTIKVKGIEVDNIFVVPYYKFQSKKYNAHINCEI